MNRETFMKDLEYLLQDIPDEEKADALSYYADYLEEAGPENEEKVLKEFGSPERITAIIRADLKGIWSLEEVLQNEGMRTIASASRTFSWPTEKRKRSRFPCRQNQTAQMKRHRKRTIRSGKCWE